MPDAPDIAISVVVPLHNEAANLALLHEKLRATLDALENENQNENQNENEAEHTYEIVLVDDGSTDATGDLIDALAEQDAHVVAARFARNFGQTAAMSAGIELARGEIIIPMDGDLQNDPADIPQLLGKLDEGYGVVSGWRRDRHDGWLRVAASRVANGIISWVSGVRLHDYGCSLKAYRREVIQGVPLYGEMHRFIPIYASWQGARVTETPVTHHARRHGASHYGFGRTIKVLLDLIVIKFLSGYMTKPIYVFGGVGMLSMIASCFTLIAALAFKFIPEDNPWDPRWHKDFVETPLPEFTVGLFVVGVQMMLMGLLAEMVMRTYFESQGRKPYIIRQVTRSAPGSRGSSTSSDDGSK